MLLKTVRILDCDSSLTRQKTLIERYRPDIVDLTEIGPSARLWANKKTAAAIQGRLDPAAKHAITLYGSGDFHHIAHLLVSQFA